MKKTNFYCLLAVLCLYVSTAAQAVPKALSIGDPVPDVAVGHVLFYDKPNFYIQQYAGKWLIIDFFHTSCGSCVSKLTHYDSLQRLFNDQLAIVLITPEPKDKVQAYWAKSRFTQGVRFPIVTSDTTLRQYFPYEFVSHEVWIDPYGKVRAITSSSYVTEKNIRTALSGAPINWVIKNDQVVYDQEIPLLAYNEKQPSALQPSRIYYSALWDAVPQSNSYFHITRDSVARTLKTSFINTPVITLYLAAVGWLLQHEPNRIVWETADREKYDPAATKLDYPVWERNYARCYETVQPLSSKPTQRMEMMRQDLDRWLGLYGRLETRETHCWLLRQKFNNNIPALPAGIARNSQLIPGTDSLQMVRTKTLVYELNALFGHLPVLDSTGMKGLVLLPPIDRKDLNNIPLINQLLQPYGFELVPSRQPIEMLVISERQ